ncbi:MAG TPA: hypothetical protein VFV19_13820 [Candidatus Polarisedimenticolaceae bacterium]|nr:hypothetical protein [Candidatus Polarisedimenticolaceae bacterium]
MNTDQMRRILIVASAFVLCTTAVIAWEDPPDGVTPPVRLNPTELPPPKVLENARFRVKLLYRVHIEPDGSVGVIELLLCGTRNEGESELSKASKEICDPIDQEIRGGVSKWKYQPAVKDDKAIAFDSVVKVDIVPSGSK